MFTLIILPLTFKTKSSGSIVRSDVSIQNVDACITIWWDVEIISETAFFLSPWISTAASDGRKREYFYPSICIYLCVSLFIYLSVYLYVRLPSTSLLMDLSIYFNPAVEFIYLSIHLFIHFSLYPSESISLLINSFINLSELE